MIIGWFIGEQLKQILIKSCWGLPSPEDAVSTFLTHSATQETESKWERAHPMLLQLQVKYREPKTQNRTLPSDWASNRGSDWLVRLEWQNQVSRRDTAQWVNLRKEFLGGPRGTENQKPRRESRGRGFYYRPPPPWRWSWQLCEF